jgi:hypothetical protein
MVERTDGGEKTPLWLTPPGLLLSAGWVGLLVVCAIYLPFWPWMLAITCKAAVALGAFKVGQITSQSVPGGDLDG